MRAEGRARWHEPERRLEVASRQDLSPKNRKWLVLTAVSVGAFISTLSGSIVNISLPTIADDFGVGISDIEWIVVAYLLTAGSLLLTFGRLGTSWATRRSTSEVSRSSPLRASSAGWRRVQENSRC